MCLRIFHLLCDKDPSGGKKENQGNGQPDDEWYELKGSETGIDGTIQDYEVTYYRPAPRAHTPWVDSEGNSGSVDMNAYHGQEYYYPNWI